MTAVEHKKGYDVKDEALAAAGKLRIEWAEAQMPVLRLIRARFAREKPLTGAHIAACLEALTGEVPLYVVRLHGQFAAIDRANTMKQRVVKRPGHGLVSGDDIRAGAGRRRGSRDKRRLGASGRQQESQQDRPPGFISSHWHPVPQRRLC